MGVLNPPALPPSLLTGNKLDGVQTSGAWVRDVLRDVGVTSDLESRFQAPPDPALALGQLIRKEPGGWPVRQVAL